MGCLLFTVLKMASRFMIWFLWLSEPHVLCLWLCSKACRFGLSQDLRIKATMIFPGIVRWSTWCGEIFFLLPPFLPMLLPFFLSLSFPSFLPFFLISSAIANAVIIYPDKCNSKDKAFILAYSSTGIYHGGEDRTPELQVGMMAARARGWLVTLHLYSWIREWLGSRTGVESFKATPPGDSLLPGRLHLL